MSQYKDRGKVDLGMPEEWRPLAMNFAAIVIPKKVDLAEIFINYHLSQAAQEAYARELFYPISHTVVLDDELAAKCHGEE